MFPVNRVVALLTPVFSAASAVGSAWLLKHFPGLPVPSTAELVAGESAGAAAAAGSALKWLHGHQKYEADIRWAEEAAKTVARDAEKVDPGITAFVKQLVKDEVAKVKPLAPFVSDIEEFASQPPAAPVDSPRPESAVTPDPLPAAPVAVPAAAVDQTVQGAVAAGAQGV